MVDSPNLLHRFLQALILVCVLLVVVPGIIMLFYFFLKTMLVISGILFLAFVVFLMSVVCEEDKERE